MGLRRASRLMRAMWTLPIILYQHAISPWLPGRCLYHPSCSTYAREAIIRHGVFWGTVLAVGRILRCTGLFFRSGYDPVPDTPSFKNLTDGFRTFRRRK